MKILDLDLPDRVKRCLIRSGIETLEQLLELKCDDLLKVRNLGKKGYTELMAFLEYNGLSMKDGIRYIGSVDDCRNRLLAKMKADKKPVLGASLNENEETPDPYEMAQLNEVLWARVALLGEKVKYLTEKCAEQKEILEIFAERLKLSAYPMDDVFTFEVSRVRNPKEFDVVEEWLKDRI